MLRVAIEGMFNTITAHSKMGDDHNKNVDEDVIQMVQLLVDEACN